jgi:hypothetical protein
MRKITKTTFKSFVKKNDGKLYIRRKYVARLNAGLYYQSNALDRGFQPAIKTDAGDYKGLTLLNRGNYFSEYEDEDFIGLQVYNWEGTWLVAIKKRGETE